MESDDRVHVPFIDILFGLAIGEIFAAASKAKRFDDISNAGYAHLVLTASLIVLSWVGYHLARRGSVAVPGFYNREFVQFLADVAILASYFILVLCAEGVPGLGGENGRHLSALPEAYIITLVFALYLVWDLLEISIRKSRSDGTERDAQCRRTVTVGFLFLMVAVALVVAATDPDTEFTVVVADVFLFILLVSYRWVGGRYLGCPVKVGSDDDL
jgi:hypothetical protein